MSDDIRAQYHNPPETPREEMWDAIVARIREEGTQAPAGVVDLAAVRRARGSSCSTCTRTRRAR